MRQLRNAIETMVVLDNDGMLDLDDLPPELAEAAPAAALDAASAGGPLELVGRTMDEIERWAIEADAASSPAATARKRPRFWGSGRGRCIGSWRSIRVGRNRRRRNEGKFLIVWYNVAGDRSVQA